MGGGMSQVLDGLYLGNSRDAEDAAALSRSGVTHIVSVHNNAKALLPEMTYLCIPASDSSNQNLIQHFRKCIKFIHESRLKGGGCLVHCLAGVSRSCTVVVAYLMAVSGLGWEESLEAVKAVRSYVDPNLGFQQQLQEYEMTLVTEDRRWLRREYGRGPFQDRERVQRALAQRHHQQSLSTAQKQWLNQSDGGYSLPYRAYGARPGWTNR